MNKTFRCKSTFSTQTPAACVNLNENDVILNLKVVLDAIFIKTKNLIIIAVDSSGKTERESLEVYFCLLYRKCSTRFEVNHNEADLGNFPEALP